MIWVENEDNGMLLPKTGFETVPPLLSCIAGMDDLTEKLDQLM